MFVVNDDLSIYATRGDTVFFNVSADDHGNPYKFQPGDIVRMAIYAKKDATTCVMQKDFPVEEVSETVFIYLEEQDTKIGESISKHKDYWYEVVLNPDTIPQTIIGYDEDGAKIFRLFPESEEIGDEPVVEPEDIPVVDSELDMTSHRPIENQAVARAVATILDVVERTNAAVAENFVSPEMYGAIGDGVADDTEAIQAALAAHNKIMFGYGKTYLVSCESNSAVMSLRKGTVIDFNYATVKLAPTSKGVYHIVNLSQDNCTIMNGTLIGDRDEHTGTVEEHGQCVTIRGKNIELINMTMMRGWGDGVFIGKYGDNPAENVRMYNCKCLENRRNGMSIGAGKNIYVNRCSFNYTQGTAPQSGFDVEPGEDGEISVFMDNIECIGNGNSPFCLANRHSTNCRVHIGKIYTDGSIVYIRSTEKSDFHIEDLYHVSKSASGIHITGGENTRIAIDSLTLDMSNETCLRAIYTDGVYDCTIGNLAIIGDKVDFLANTDNCNINIGRLAYRPVVPGVSISKTNINIDTVAHKSEVITASNKQPKMFINEVVFDGTESITATIFCRNYPNEFTMKAYNPTSVSHDIYCDDGMIVSGETEKSRFTLNPGKMVEMRYHKTAGKWVVNALF